MNLLKPVIGLHHNPSISVILDGDMLLFVRCYPHYQ